MKVYLDLLRDTLSRGELTPNRTGVSAYRTFGRQMRFDLTQGFPLVTTKKVSWKWVLREMLWFISGSHNAKALEDQGVTIWKEWGDKETRELGPVYGYAWRNWGGFKSVEALGVVENHYNSGRDQLQKAIDLIKSDPTSRRNIVTAWNPDLLPYQALPPCHILFQFSVTYGKLDLHMFQRSADMFLGVPFNIASYAFLQHMVARLVGLEAGTFVHTLSDVHIYENHRSVVEQQLDREPKPLPKIMFSERSKAYTSIDQFTFEDVWLDGYEYHPALEGAVAV
jgi:thymidylate synthase